MVLDFVKIGKRIRQGRLERGMSQEKLAERVFISAQYLSVIENNRKNASLKVLARIAKELGTTIDEILFGDHRFKWKKYQRELNLLLADCSGEETKIIFDVVRTLKRSLREIK